MPLTPEQQALKESAIAAQKGVWERLMSTFDTDASPEAILALLSQLEAQEAPGDPEFSHDPDGELCMEWYVGDAAISVSIGGVGRVSWAMLAGDKKASGARLFANERTVPAQTGIKEAALQALADQAQELGMGYEGMLMPSSPGSAGDVDVVNTSESLSAAEGSMEDFADAADLVDAMTSAEAKGDALGLVLAYRHEVRAAALSQPVQAVPDERKE